MPDPSRVASGARLERRRLALLHALLVTGLTTAVTGCAHSLAGGSAPSPIALAAACMATLVVLAPILGARATWPRRIAGVVVAQALQHALYALPQPQAAPGAGGHHGQHAAAVLAPTATAAHEHGDMLLAHVLAGAVTLAVIGCGAAALAALVGALRGDRLVAAQALAVPLGVAEPAAVDAERPALHPLRAVPRSPLLRRGPPALLV